jgi:ubiquinone/menaquinone biosynthesis C-methylase UbiE
MKRIKTILFIFINNILSRLNYQLLRIDKPVSNNNSNKILLNLGSGNWSCKGWINLDYPSKWYASSQKKHTIIPYDIRNDDIPFDNDSTDAIYCSHVIEHLENIHIQKMFSECYRVLKKNGILRIVCPDAEFLYQVSKSSNDYWNWRNQWFSSKSFYVKDNTPRNVDYLVREVATPKLIGYVNSINNIDYYEAFEKLEMYEFFEYLTKDLFFKTETIGAHINYWTFDKVKKMLKEVGFSTIILSKWNGSVSEDMKLKTKFDVVYPQMSLYVEAIK